MEKRKPLSRREFGLLIIQQEGKCGKCACRLDFTQPKRVVDEHLHPLADGGGNEITNRALYCYECAKGKTVKEVTPRARSKRYAEGRTQYDKRKAAGGSRIRSGTNWPKGRKLPTKADRERIKGE